MNKIEKLISELCPDGVEFKELRDLFQISRGRVMSKEYLVENAGDFPVYSSQTANNGEIGKIKTFDYDGEYLTWTTDGANAGTIFYRTGKFSITNVCGLLKIKDELVLNSKYAFYCLSINMKNYVNYGMGNPKLMSNVVEKIQIPIPPIKIQEEIVKILDTFTLLEAELEAELEARKKQYEYYRDEMLSFGDDEVEWKSLGEVGNYSKTRISSSELNHENYVGVDNLLQNKQGKTNSSYVPTSGNLTKYENGDILIGNIRPYLKKIWKADNIGGTNGDVLVIRIKDKEFISSEYLYYLLSSESFFNYDMKYAKGAKMPRGDKDSIMKFSIQIPSLEKQQEIVENLDKFDALVNDISVGLPAEIKARRLQYEYYRNKLLDFKVLEK